MSSLPPRRSMRIYHTCVALFLVGVLTACTAAQDKSPDAKPAPEHPPTDVPDPMASFARMTPGEWRVTAQSGTSMFDTWHWGPGRHSMRVMTDGCGAAGDPWREVQVFYWHPGHKQVRLLGLSPFSGGVSEGTIKFDGDSADGVFDLHQAGAPPRRRKLGLHWAFEGLDTYRDTLLEATPSDSPPSPDAVESLKPVNEWVHVRSLTPGVRPPLPDEAPKFPEQLRSFEPLVGHTWEAGGKGKWAGADDFHIQTTFEWVPYADAIYARTVAVTNDGQRTFHTHLFDAYFYHHTGTGVLRFLALSRRGGVYEGDLTMLDGGAMQLDLKGYEGEQVVPRVVRFDLEQDGTLRHRVWSVDGAERTLMLDVHHKKVEPVKE